MRRALIIIAGGIVAGGIAAVVYFYFFAPSASLSVAPPATTSLPTAGNTSAPSPTQQTGTSTPIIQPRVLSRLVKIDAGPVVAGEVATDVNVLPDGTLAPKPSASTTPDVQVSYISRQSGNIYAYREGAQALTRTSNKTVPGIQEAVWLPDGSSALVRYLSGSDSSTINTYELPANGIGGFFLPQNIAQVSTASSSILALASGANGSVATREHADGSNGARVFSTPLSMLRATFAGQNAYLAYTKASAALDGDAYIVDSGGNFSRIAGPLPGLTALASPSGNWVLISWVVSGVMKMELVNVKTRATIALPVATIADKCVWTLDERALYCGIPTSPSAAYAYPDDWYQGAVSFSDRIWKIDVAGRLAQLTLDFSSQARASLDATALAIDPKGQYLVFLNKNDGALWSYQL
jgi:hypothetical protein